MNIKADNTQQLAVPFNHEKLDRLMAAAGIDVLVATSKHNVQYLLGGYKFIFFAAMATRSWYRSSRWAATAVRTSPTTTPATWAGTTRSTRRRVS